MIRGLHGQGAGDGHALAHAPRELVRVLLLGARETDLAHPRARHLLPLVPGHTPEHEAEGHVVDHREPGVGAVALEHHPPVGAGSFDGLSAQQRFARGRGEEPGHDVEDRALAAPRRPQEHAELALAGVVRDLEVDVLDGVELLALRGDEGLAHLLELEDVRMLGVRHQDFQLKSALLRRRMIWSVTTPMIRITMTRAKIWSTCERLAATVMRAPRP